MKKVRTSARNVEICLNLFGEAVARGLAERGVICKWCEKVTVTVPIIVRYTKERAMICLECLPAFRARVNRELGEWLTGSLVS